MARDDIAKHQFTSENQPRKRRSRKGIPNRATALKKLLACKVNLQRPHRLQSLLPTGTKTQKGTVEEQIALALIGKALCGDVPAIREILDTVYGKLTDKQEHLIEQPQQITIIEARQIFAERRKAIEQLDDDGP